MTTERSRVVDRHGSDEPRYGLILLSVLTLYILSSVSTRSWIPPVLSGLAAIVLGLALPRNRAGRRWLIAGGALGFGVLAGAIATAAAPTDTRSGAVDIAIAVLMLAAAWVLLTKLVTRAVITTATVFGAIDVYVLVGVAFSVLYHGVQTLSGDPYFLDGVEGTRNMMSYFSFVTMTTLGYGDLTPASDLGRTLAVVQVLLGQILVVTVIARLVSSVRHPRDAAAIADS